VTQKNYAWIILFSYKRQYKSIPTEGARRMTEGKQTYAATTRYRTHTCGELRLENINTRARLAGWVHRIRNHGGLIFLDLRDHYGLTQAVVSPNSPSFAIAQQLNAEWVVRLDGIVATRPSGTTNLEFATGEIELAVDQIEILSAAEELPLPVFGEPEFPEDVRLKFRFLDLRRRKLHRNMILRSNVIWSLRQQMINAGFTEFQTPILTASSPEGARDFLVPSRLHPGKFYALPQAPQQFKQLIMMAGFDRYFQIAPCFRDEDARADRSPGEFYQLDIEMSFVEQEDVFRTIEPIMQNLFREFGNGKSVTKSFPRIPYAEAIRRFGSDKPDLRNPIEIFDATEVFRESEYQVFTHLINSDPRCEVWAIPAPKGGTKKFCEYIDNWAKEQKQPGLSYLWWREDTCAAYGPIAKRLSAAKIEFLQLKSNLGAGDALFFLAGNPKKIYRFAGETRQKLASDLGLIDHSKFEFCWITDFPMYEWNDIEKKVDFCHNPFSMPQGGLEALESAKTVEEKLAIKAFQYDIVCNGVELSSGAIRNHLPEIMRKAFSIAGHASDVLEDKFGGMLRAMQYGAPPHGGIAPGIDRIVMLLAGVDNLRDVIMFPMNQRGEDLMMGAPNYPSTKQLKELSIKPLGSV
jgi:aspartyl-tRNA synthetase